MVQQEEKETGKMNGVHRCVVACTLACLFSFPNLFGVHGRRGEDDSMGGDVNGT